MTRGKFSAAFWATFCLLAAGLSCSSPAQESGQEVGQVSAQEEPAGKPVRAGILIYDGVFNTEFIAPLDIFNHAQGRIPGRFQVFTVAPTREAVTTAENLRVLPDYGFDDAPTLDWLVVPSGENYLTDIKDKRLVDWISSAGERAQVIHSNCWGAFLLAAAGLLDGREATTYPSSFDEFAERFPKVKVRRDAQLVDDNGAVTTAGGVISYDGALYLIEKYYGLELARSLADGLVIDWDARRTALTKVVLPKD